MIAQHRAPAAAHTACAAAAVRRGPTQPDSFRVAPHASSNPALPFLLTLQPSSPHRRTATSAPAAAAVLLVVAEGVATVVAALLVVAEDVTTVVAVLLVAAEGVSTVVAMVGGQEALERGSGAGSEHSPHDRSQCPCIHPTYGGSVQYLRGGAAR